MERFRLRLGLLVTLLVGSLYGIETYISSGWAKFVRDTSIFGVATSRKADAIVRPDSNPSKLQELIHAFQETFLFSDNSSNNAEAQEGSGDIPGGLQRLISSSLHCDKSTSELVSRLKTKPQLSIWFSPYRQFPEAGYAGENRGKGAYEYFSYISDAKCGRIASNYGAFKGSPADRVFKEASDQGLRQELLLSKKLGYILFVLDLKKAWLSKSDADYCKINYTLCVETSDGFLVIGLKEFDNSAKRTEFLRHSLRMGENQSLSESLEASSLSAVRPGHWFDWEYPSPGSALRWSNGRQGKFPRTDALTPLAGGNIPSNLKISLVANPFLRKVLVEATCTRGKQPIITMTTYGSSDITKDFDMCMPRNLRPISASAYNGESKMQQAPMLADRDQRGSYFGIQYSLKDVTR
jgi:hypothetical protein